MFERIELRLDGAAVGFAAGLVLGLSLPVGPLPRGGRLAGGRLSAARRALFSSSSSATLFSRALEEGSTEMGDRGEGDTDLEMGSSPRAERSLYVAGPVGGQVVVAFAAAL